MVQEIESIIRSGKVEESDCILLSTPYDRTACGGKGARFGCREIVECLSYHIEFLDRITLTEPGYAFRIMHEEIALSNEMPPEEMVAAVAAKVGKHLDRRLTILLGGDHSVSIGAFRALASQHDPATVTLVQIDAHCDLREDDADSNLDRSCISRFSHASVMRRAHEMGFPIVQVGIRSYSREEHQYFTTAQGITVFEWGEFVPAIDEVIGAIGTEKVYLTLDVDGIDPAHMPATGTPVQGGLEWHYAENLVRMLVRRKTLVGADIVEVAPLEGDLLTQMGAARLAYALIGEALMKRARQVSG